MVTRSDEYTNELLKNNYKINEYINEYLQNYDYFLKNKKINLNIKDKFKI